MTEIAYEIKEMERITREILGIEVDNMDIKISYILKQLEIDCDNLGYRYLKDAIKLAIEDPREVDIITKRLYVDVAKMNKTSPIRVEKDLRYAISKIKKSNVKTAIFLGVPKDHYRNKEFILSIIDFLGYLH